MGSRVLITAGWYKATAGVPDVMTVRAGQFERCRG